MHYSINFAPRKRRAATPLQLMAALALTALVAQLMPAGSVRATITNPPLVNSCGLDVSLVVDISGSISSSEMSQLKGAMTAFASAFSGTPTQFSLTKFNHTASVVRPFSLTPAQAVTAIANDIPTQGTGYTNWDDGLAKGFSTFDPRPAKPNLIIIGTDGNPNRYGPNGLPANGEDTVAAMAHAVARADLIKGAGTRILAIGIGDGLNINNLKAITGTNSAPPNPISLGTDVITADFGTLATAMANLARTLCGGRILVQTQFDTNGDGTPDVLGGTSNSLLAGYGFDVTGTPSDPSAQTTTDTGTLEFADILNGSYTLSEPTLALGTRLTSATCSRGGNPIGTVDLTARTVTGLTMGTDDTISCTFVHTYVPAQLTVIKQVVNDDSGTRQAGDFTLTVNGPFGFTQSFPGSTTGTPITFMPGDYNVTEATPSDYTMTQGPECSGTIAPGESRTCVVTNNDVHQTQCILEISKQVSSATTSVGASLTYTINVENVGDADCTGGGVKIEDEVDSLLNYVSETHSSNVDPGYGGDPVFFGNTVRWNAHELTPGESATVGWTATVLQPSVCGPFDIANTARVSSTEYNWQWVVSNTVHTTGTMPCTGKLIVRKEVVNDNGGVKQPNDFTINVSGQNPTPNSFPGSTSGTNVTLEPGVYSVDENQLPGYAMTLQGECSGTIAAGETKTCTVVNDDIQQQLRAEPVATCTGSGELYLYQGNQTQPLATSFTTSGSQLAIFTRRSFLTALDVKVNGVSQTLTTVLNTSTPFPVRIYSVATAPGDLIEVTGTSTNGARAIQGYLVQDSANPVYDLATFQLIFDDAVANDMYLTPGQYSYVFFDKYTNNEDGSDDSRVLTVDVDGPGGDLVNQSYTKPAPVGSQGAVVGSFNVASGSEGTHTLSITTTDSVYWPKAQCPAPPSPATLVVKKVVVNDDGGTLAPADFTMLVTGTNPSPASFPGSTAGTSVTLEAGTYTVDEQLVTGYTKSFSADCTGTIAAGETKTCTVTNDDDPPPPPSTGTLIVKKVVVNDNAGTAQPADFTLAVTGTNPSPASFPGSATGVSVTLGAGAYSADEQAVTGYTKSLSADCTGTIAAGQTKTCTITNDDNAPATATLIVIKQVVNDNGGSLQPANFTMAVSGTNVSPASFPGASGGTTVTLNAGTFQVTETQAGNYSAAMTGDCSGTIAAGETKTCTVINNDPSGGGGGGGGGGGPSCSAVNTPSPSSIGVTVAEGSSVTSPNVTLNLTFGTVATGVVLSNFSNFSNQVYVAASGGTTRNWTLLPGNGAKTIYARFYGQGNYCSTDTNVAVTLNETPPPQVLGESCANVALEREQSKSNAASVAKHKGRMVKQCDSGNSVWYVDPASGQRFYLPPKAATYGVLKLLATGITNANLAKIPTTTSAAGADPVFTQKQLGRVFMQVEAKGELWYVNPGDGKRYFVPSSDEAAAVVAGLATCVADSEARQLSVGLEANGTVLASISSCYPPAPRVLGVQTLPRTGLPIGALAALPLMVVFALGAAQVGKDWVTG